MPEFRVATFPGEMGARNPGLIVIFCCATVRIYRAALLSEGQLMWGAAGTTLADIGGWR